MQTLPTLFIRKVQGQVHLPNWALLKYPAEKNEPARLSSFSTVNCFSGLKAILQLALRPEQNFHYLSRQRFACSLRRGQI